MATPSLPDPLSQLQSDVRAIVVEVENITGRKSRWSSRILVGTELDRTGAPLYFGAKHWNCDIVIHQDRLAHSGKYSSLIHEAFHSVSEGLNEPDFQLCRGLEEGVVEACTRLFRDTILASASLPPSTDIRISYNRYLALLENLRLRTIKTDADFYLSLLATRLSAREATVLQWIQDAEPAKSFLLIEQETDAIRQGLKI